MGLFWRGGNLTKGTCENAEAGPIAVNLSEKAGDVEIFREGFPFPRSENVTPGTDIESPLLGVRWFRLS
jgi:hypothetical protein